MTLVGQNITMFISDNGMTVYQDKFRELVHKHPTKKDIDFYIRRSNEYTDNFFEPSNNMEVVVFQNIIWNGVLKFDLEETAISLCFYGSRLKGKFKKIVRLQFEKDIVTYYKILTEYKNQMFVMKGEMKIHINKMNQEYPLYNYGFGQTFYKLSNTYYQVKDVLNIITAEFIKTTAEYEKYKKDIMTTMTLCFKHNFELPFYFKIEEKAFINQIESCLF
jgi:hypothetical protein